MPKRALELDVTYRGVFFTGNPVGTMHRNQYDVLKEAGEQGEELIRRQLQPGHGYLTGALHDSVAARPLRASRGVSFSGRLAVITGRQGYNQVRRYSRKIDKQYRLMTNARSALTSWVQGNSGRIASMLTRGLV